MTRDIHLSFAGGQVQVLLSADEALHLMERLRERLCGREIEPGAASLAAEAVARANSVLRKNGQQPI